MLPFEKPQLNPSIQYDNVHMRQDRKAIVIGASSGIGLEVAKLLVKEGWQVGVAARRVELMQGIGAVAVERIDVTAVFAH